MNLREQFDAAKAESLAITNKAKTEARNLSDEEKATVEKQFARMTEIKSQLDTEKKMAALELEAEAEKAVETVKAIVTQTTFAKDNMDKIEVKEDKNAKIIESVKQFARSGDYKQFALTSGTNSGVLMPKSVPFFQQIRQPQNAFRRGFAALSIPTFSSSSTDNVNAPFIDDSSNSANNDQEGATSGANADASTVTGNLNLVEYHSKAAWYSKKLVHAEDFDITAAVLPQQLSRIERQEETDWVALLKADSAIVGVTAASTTAITLDETINFDESLPAAYDSVPSFYIVSKTLKKLLRKLKDTTGEPVLTETNSGLVTLYGKPLVVSAAMEAVAAGAMVGALVCTENVIIRDTTVNEFVRYENMPQYPGQIGYEAFGWSAFAYSTKAIRTLVMAAS